MQKKNHNNITKAIANFHDYLTIDSSQFVC